MIRLGNSKFGYSSESDEYVSSLASRYPATAIELCGLAPDDAELYQALLASSRSTVSPRRRGWARPAHLDVCWFEDAHGSRYGYVPIGGGACLVECAPADAEIIVPERVDGRPVWGIGALTFSNLTRITRIVLPDSAIDVGRQAFGGCPSLREVVFSPFGRTFDHSWLHGCSHLERLVLPGCLETISPGDMDIPSLRSVVVGAGTTGVAPLAFAKASLDRIEVDAENPVFATDGCALFDEGGTRLVAMTVRLSHYQVPAGTKCIGEKAFAYDKALESVDLPEGLERIGGFAFFESALTSIRVPGSVREIETKAFCQCDKLEHVVLDEGVAVVGSEAFSRTAIQTLLLPASLVSLGRNAVDRTPLASTSTASGLKVSSENERYLLDGAGGVYVRRDDGLALEAIVGESSTYRVLPGTVSIETGAARNNKHLRSLVLSEGVRTIGAAAFASCSNLVDVTLPNTLEIIEEEAFACTSIERMALPASLSYIGILALNTGDTQWGGGPPTLRELSVDPENERFFMRDGILCERLDDGGIKVLLRVGTDPVIVIPDDVISIWPYAFSNIRGVRDLHIREDIGFIGVRGLAFGNAPSTLYLTFAEPIEGRTCFVGRIPSEKRVLSSFLHAFRGPHLDAKEICSTCDMLTLRYGTIFEQGKSAVERLTDPVLLDERSQRFYEEMLTRLLKEVCVEFATHRFVAGFDLLADLGYLDERTITDVIDAVSESGNVAMTGYILELKHRRFGGTRLDFEL